MLEHAPSARHVSPSITRKTSWAAIAAAAWWAVTETMALWRAHADKRVARR